MWASQYIFFLISEFSFVLRFEFFFEVSQLYSYMLDTTKHSFILSCKANQSDETTIVLCNHHFRWCCAVDLSRTKPFTFILYVTSFFLFYFQCTYLTIVSCICTCCDDNKRKTLPWFFFETVTQFQFRLSFIIALHFV